MVKTSRKFALFRHILWITIVYFLAQSFLLIATGRWWDDWVYADKNWDYMLEVFRQSSLPLHAFINASLWLFPDGFYRIITFFLFYVGSIFVFLILRKLGFLKEQECFWITMLYCTIPINDARITWICYGYSLGLFLFWLAFYLSTIWKEKCNYKFSFLRVISLLLLFLSYDTESIMLMTLLLLGFFYYKDLEYDWKQRCWKDNVKNFFRTVINHFDYLSAPIIWYVLSKVLFPGYGVYGGHSYISWSELPRIILKSPYYALCSFKNILTNYISIIKEFRVIYIAISIMVIYVVLFVVRGKIEQGHKCLDKENFRRSIYLLSLGVITFFIGFFPYAVKRNREIYSIYTDGRDTLLLGLGLAMMIYYGISIFFRGKVGKVIITSVIVLGIIHFNCIYLDWQESYYQQLQLQDEFKKNEWVHNNDTFLVIYEGAIISTHFYQTNGNSWASIGDQKRFFMSGTRDIRYLVEETEDTLWLLEANGMNEYDYGDRVIDGIIFVKYEDIPRNVLVKQKWNELFNKESFTSWIHEIKDIKYVPITLEESDKIIQMYKVGGLTNEVIYDMYLN